MGIRRIFNSVFPRSKNETVGKRCPHCGKSLNDSMIKCPKCEQWVTHEVFDRLCAEDVTLIKNNDLDPMTPSMVALVVLSTVADSKLEDYLQKAPGRQLSAEQQFKLLVFEAYCRFEAIRMNAKTKRGCRDSIMKALKTTLLNEIAEAGVEYLEGVPGKTVSAEEYSRVLELLGGEAAGVHDRLEAVRLPIGDVPSQLRLGEALGSIVLGENHLFDTLFLYQEYVGTLWYTREAASGIFLVEEEDWPSVGTFIMEEKARQVRNMK